MTSVCLPPHPAMPYLFLVRSMRLLSFVTLLILFLRSSALASVVEYANDTDTWKRFIERQVRREVAGKRPPVDAKITWKDYWISWYDEIRISSGLPWPSSEFKSHEAMIRFIKSRLKAHGLPAYE
jgi:hypothetical protein